jgi:hypothetical protein
LLAKDDISVKRNVTVERQKYGGIDVPVADTARQTVTSVPLSPEVMEPICFLPFRAIIPSGA